MRIHVFVVLCCGLLAARALATQVDALRCHKATQRRIASGGYDL